MKLKISLNQKDTLKIIQLLKTLIKPQITSVQSTITKFLNHNKINPIVGIKDN